MPRSANGSFLHESSLTRVTTAAALLVMLATAGYLGWSYPSLPDLLPVHFRWDGQPNGWQYRTIGRAFTPLFVQLGIFSICAAIGGLLLSRKDADNARALPDARAAVVAVEAVMLIAIVWIAFQCYVAYALVRLWSSGGATLGRAYNALELIGVVVTGVVFARAQGRLSRPEPLPYVPTHWRLGHLYCNAEHPALFVPTRDGRKWTLNFGRPAAVVLLGGLIGAGLIAPALMMLLAFR